MARELLWQLPVPGRPRTSAVLPLALCLGFTAPASAWADSAQLSRPPEHHGLYDATGVIARFGSGVGWISAADKEITVLGMVAAIGHRWNRFSIEAEGARLGAQPIGPSSEDLGTVSRLGVVARVDVLRLGSLFAGPNSMVSLYTEAYLGAEWRRWVATPGEAADMPPLPNRPRQTETAIGFGFQLDHRLRRPLGLRIGWQLGWRLSAVPREPPSYACRGSSCRSTAEPPRRSFDTSLLLASSLSFTW